MQTIKVLYNNMKLLKYYIHILVAIAHNHRGSLNHLPVRLTSWLNILQSTRNRQTQMTAVSCVTDDSYVRRHR